MYVLYMALCTGPFTRTPEASYTVLALWLLALGVWLACVQGGSEMAHRERYNGAVECATAGGVPRSLQPLSGRGDLEGGGGHPHAGPLPGVVGLDANACFVSA